MLSQELTEGAIVQIEVDLGMVPIEIDWNALYARSIPTTLFSIFLEKLLVIGFFSTGPSLLELDTTF